MTHLRPETEDALYPGLMDGLRLAYQQNVENGTTAPEVTRTLGSVARAAATESPQPTTETVLNELDPEFRDVVEWAHASTASLLEYIDTPMPDLLDFTAAGLNLKGMQRVNEALRKMRLERKFVFAPVLGAQQWQGIFRGLQDDPEVNATNQISNGGLDLDLLDNQWDNLQRGGQNASRTLRIEGQRWQVVILPGAEHPPLTQLDYYGRPPGSEYVSEELKDQIRESKTRNGQIDNFHPTLDEYLTLQAGRLQMGGKPVDRFFPNLTWIESNFSEPHGVKAAYGYWDPVRKQVKLGIQPSGERGKGVGVRLPFWAERST